MMCHSVGIRKSPQMFTSILNEVSWIPAITVGKERPQDWEREWEWIKPRWGETARG